MRFARRLASKLVLGVPLLLANAACGRQAVVSADGLPLQRVVVYRNGVGYFERAGHVDESEVRFKMKEGEVGDFLASLAVIEKGGSSVRAAAFPLDGEDEDDAAEPPPAPEPPHATRDGGANAPPKKKKKPMKTVVLSLDGRAHDLQVGYIAASPVWRPSYRLVVRPGGEADLQAWGIVQNLSGEDWTNVRLSLVAGAPLAFEAQLGTAVIPDRPTVTDEGEVIAAVPHAETSLAQGGPASAPMAPPPMPAPEAEAAADEAESEKDEAPKKAPVASRKRGAPSRAAAPPPPGIPGGVVAGTLGGTLPPQGAGAAYGRWNEIPKPRNLQSLAAVAVEGGATRYDLPAAVTVPDQSATMVMLLARKVSGEAIFLFAPDGGVPDSAKHPFRVARFTNATGGALERGPIAVFEEGSFLGQGMVDPLPPGATTTVPFALERGIAVDSDRRYDELGERVAKIENGQLTIARDSVSQTKYRVRNGADTPSKVLVKHGRAPGTRLFQPPPGTEDNVGTQTALVPTLIAPKSTSDLLVDERRTLRRNEDWFSPVADNALKAYFGDPKADRGTVAKLQAAWAIRREIQDKSEARQKLAVEQGNLGAQTEETRRNLRAIEKNKAADALRAKLTARLGETAARLDEITKQAVELDAKLAELRVRFKEAVRDVTVVTPAAQDS